jgi:hypothetical protein
MGVSENTTFSEAQGILIRAQSEKVPINMTRADILSLNKREPAITQSQWMWRLCTIIATKA